MGKGQRSGLYRAQDNPGPGAYDKKTTFAGPKYKIAGRRSASADNFTPGPGQYAPDYRQPHKLVTYQYTMRGRSSVTSGNNNAPGPGSYDAKAKGTGIGAKFGTDQRRSMSLASGHVVPGPGAYNIDKSRAATRHPASPKYRFACAALRSQ